MSTVLFICNPMISHWFTVQPFNIKSSLDIDYARLILNKTQISQLCSRHESVLSKSIYQVWRRKKRFRQLFHDIRSPTGLENITPNPDLLSLSVSPVQAHDLHSSISYCHMTQIKTAKLHNCYVYLQRRRSCFKVKHKLHTLVLESSTARMLILAVMHESIYCGVYIMNEEELHVQICELHKESKGIMGKRAVGDCLFYGFIGEAPGCVTCMFPK